jgi:glycosyltransferase involved in cell wall biosynthesis
MPEAHADAGNDPSLVASLDAPADGERVGRALLVTGWAVSSTGREVQAEASVGAGPSISVPMGQRRPDVEAVHPSAGPRAGFMGLILLGEEATSTPITVTITDSAGHRVDFRRVVEPVSAGSSSPSTVPFDAMLLAWLCTPLEPASPYPRATVGAAQLRDARDLFAAFPALEGPGRFNYLEWLYHLWKNEGEDALPLALVAACWLPPGATEHLRLSADWPRSTWGHGILPWLNDDVDEAQPDRTPLTRAAILAWQQRPDLQRRFRDPFGRDRGSLAAHLATGDAVGAHIELAAPLEAAGRESAPRRRPRWRRDRPVDVAAELLASPGRSLTALDRKTWRRTPRPVGVNLVGHFAATSGLGEATRCTLRSAEAAGVAIDLLDLGPRTDLAGATPLGVPGHPCPFAVTVVHDNAAHAPATLRRLGRRFVLDRRTVGYWYWETAEPPDAVADVTACLDEVWVASHFVAKVLTQASSVPVSVVPPAVDLEDATPAERRRFGIPAGSTCFLTMASVDSVLERKNPFGALDAFRRAFGGTGHGDAVLLMKLAGLDQVPGVRGELRNRIGEMPVVVIDQVMSRSELRSLVAMADVVVSLHRAEGFGLPLAEAMGAGRATIATEWSGNADFTSSTTAYAVPYTLTAIAQDFGPYRRGMHWAEPDLDAAAAMMRSAHDDPDGRQSLAAAGRRLIREVYAAEVTGPVLRSHIERLASSTS